MLVPLSDAELARAAQGGDVSCLGLVLARHWAGMYAVAVSVLGYGPDAEDAVQEAALVALTRIVDVRDPEAVGSWLRMVVRNACRMRLRQPRPVALTDLIATTLASGEPSPEDLLDRHALRDWIWHALAQLSEPLRMVTLLRYFTQVSSYDEIAAVCGVPVGTVRSRLSQAKSKLAEALLASADVGHADIWALTESRRQQAVGVMQAAQQGSFAGALADSWHTHTEIIGPQGQRARGLPFLVHMMNSDLEAGVRQRITNVVANIDVTVWEAELISPPDDPRHCPPGVLWLQTLWSGRVERLRLFHPVVEGLV